MHSTAAESILQTLHHIELEITEDWSVVCNFERELWRDIWLPRSPGLIPPHFCGDVYSNSPRSLEVPKHNTDQTLANTDAEKHFAKSCEMH